MLVRLNNELAYLLNYVKFNNILEQRFVLLQMICKTPSRCQQENNNEKVIDYET